MNSRSSYFNFVKENGISLAEINPGSKEFALIAVDAIKAITLLQNSNYEILGGDILTINNEKLKYAYQIWGESYQYLNWFCNKLEGETSILFVKRSSIVARESIKVAIEIAREKEMDCYVSLIFRKAT